MPVTSTYGRTPPNKHGGVGRQQPQVTNELDKPTEETKEPDRPTEVTDEPTLEKPTPPPLTPHSEAQKLVTALGVTPSQERILQVLPLTKSQVHKALRSVKRELFSPNYKPKAGCSWRGLTIALNCLAKKTMWEVKPDMPSPTVRNLHSKFIRERPSFAVSLSTFCQARPATVKLARYLPLHKTC